MSAPIERHVVNAGWGRFDVYEGRSLSPVPLTRDEAVALARRKTTIEEVMETKGVSPLQMLTAELERLRTEEAELMAQLETKKTRLGELPALIAKAREAMVAEQHRLAVANSERNVAEFFELANELDKHGESPARLNAWYRHISILRGLRRVGMSHEAITMLTRRLRGEPEVPPLRGNRSWAGQARALVRPLKQEAA